MLDIRFVKESSKLVKDNIKKKYQEEKLVLVDKTIENYNKLLKFKKQEEELRHRRNQLSLEINSLVKRKIDASTVINEVKGIPGKIKVFEDKRHEIEMEMNAQLSQIPSIMHSSVPKGKNHLQNKVIKKNGKIPKFSFQVKNHVELGEQLRILDFDSSAETSGNGFYYMKGKLALLNQALIRFVIDFMSSKKYHYIETPLMINKKVAAAAGDLEAFEKALYKIEGEDLYMIPTAEHSVLGMHINKVFKDEELPKKYFSYSMCFRKEIGSHGINEKGLWRTHQFNKVEQFIFCRPDDSWKIYEELRKNTEQIFQKLKLPYRVLESCSGDLGNWKAKSEDIEVYRPTTKQYEEVTSLSNCTDYQARDLNIKFVNKNGEKQVVHTLNNTAIATSRALVAIMENYQTKKGEIKIPTVLQKYAGFKEIKKSQ